MSYRIKSVAALTGIPATTLRAWERRYELVSPDRTEGGYRVYTEDDIAALTKVKALVDRGYRVSEAISIVRRGAPELPPADVAGEELAGLREEVLCALLAMDRMGARDAYDRLATVTFDRQIDEVIVPVLREIGDRWHGGQASVAQEHFATAFLRGRLTAMLESLAGGARWGGEVVCAGAPGEAHELGLMAAAVHLALRGWKIVYLGSDLPLDELGPVLKRRRPELVCTSLLVPRSDDEVLQIAGALREASPRGTTVVVGGRGISAAVPSNPWPDTFLLHTMEQMLQLPLLADA